MLQAEAGGGGATGHMALHRLAGSRQHGIKTQQKKTKNSSSRDTGSRATLRDSRVRDDRGGDSSVKASCTWMYRCVLTAWSRLHHFCAGLLIVHRAQVNSVDPSHLHLSLMPSLKHQTE